MNVEREAPPPPAAPTMDLSIRGFGPTSMRHPHAFGPQAVSEGGAAQGVRIAPLAHRHGARRIGKPLPAVAGVGAAMGPAGIGKFPLTGRLETVPEFFAPDRLDLLAE